MNTDPEAIAREILRLDADRSAAKPQGDFFDYMVALRKTAPTLAAAYLDLRAQLDAVTAQRDELREAADAFTDHADGLDRNTYWPRLGAAILAAQ